MAADKLQLLVTVNVHTSPSVAGVYGFLTFGKDARPDILMSYTSSDVLMLIARLLFGISIITIYPITLLLGRSATLQLNLVNLAHFSI